MEDDKFNLGPESPADLEWSQGAKNTRTTEEIDDFINLGTYLDETLEGDGANEYDDRPDGTSVGDTTMASEHDDEQPSENRQISEQDTDAAHRAPEGETSNANESSGPPEGDTADGDRKKRRKLTGAQRKRLAREKGKTLPAGLKKRPADTSPVNPRAPKKPAPEPRPGLPPNKPKRARIWCCDTVRKKTSVFAKLKENPQLTAIAINQSDLFGALSVTQSNAIIKMLMEDIVKMPFNQKIELESFVPRFQWYRRIQGLLVFLCVDTRTVNWLANVNFTRAWEGAKIRILIERDFSKLVLCKTIIPKSEKSDADILRMLKFQNREINFTRWELKERNQVNSGYRLFVLMDVPSLRTIRSMGMKLYYGLSRLSFQVLSPEAEIDPISSSNPPKFEAPKSQPTKSILPFVLNKFSASKAPSHAPIINNPPSLLALNNTNLPALMSHLSSLAATQTLLQAYTAEQQQSRFGNPPNEQPSRFEPPKTSFSSQYRPVRSPRSRALNKSNGPRKSTNGIPSGRPPQTTSNKSSKHSFWIPNSASSSLESFGQSQSSNQRTRSPPRTRTPPRTRSPPRTNDRFRSRTSPIRSQSSFGSNLRDRPRDIGGTMSFQRPRDIHDISRDFYNNPRDVHDISKHMHDTFSDPSVIPNWSLYDKNRYQPF